jgi:hypothetical protein
MDNKFIRRTGTPKRPITPQIVINIIIDDSMFPKEINQFKQNPRGCEGHAVAKMLRDMI